MNWRKPHGDHALVSPRALQPGDLIISQIGGGHRGEWHLRYYLVKPATTESNQS